MNGFSFGVRARLRGLHASVIRGSETPAELHSLPLLPTCGPTLAVPEIYLCHKEKATSLRKLTLTATLFRHCLYLPPAHLSLKVLPSQAQQILCCVGQKYGRLTRLERFVILLVFSCSAFAFICHRLTCL